MNAPGREGRGELPLGSSMPKEVTCFAWVRKTFETVRLGRHLDLSHGRGTSHHSLGCSRRISIVPQICSATSSCRCMASTTTQRSGSAVAIIRKPSRRRSWYDSGRPS